MSPVRTRHNLYFALAAALLVTVGYTAGRYERCLRAEPKSVTEAVARLEARGLVVYLTPIDRKGNLSSGAYLCDRPRSRKELWMLPRQGSAPGWEGTLCLTMVPRSDGSLHETLWEWGPNAAIVGEVLLFGDANLVREAAKALR
jgi:hypothetical protein